MALNPWHLRRGMKELDVVFERYHRTRYPSAPAPERAAFEALLDTEDPEIWAWIMGYAEPPASFAAVIGVLRERH